VPSWLSINPATGQLTGNPVAPYGFSNFGITVSDGTDTVTRYFNLQTHFIHITCAQCTNPGQLPNAQQGQTYTASLGSTGGTGTVTFTANGLGNLGLTVASGM